MTQNPRACKPTLWAWKFLNYFFSYTRHLNKQYMTSDSILSVKKKIFGVKELTDSFVSMNSWDIIYHPKGTQNQIPEPVTYLMCEEIFKSIFWYVNGRQINKQ